MKHLTLWLLRRIVLRRFKRNFLRYCVLTILIACNTALVLAAIQASISAVASFQSSTSGIAGGESIELVSTVGSIKASKVSEFLQSVCEEYQCTAIRKAAVSIKNGDKEFVTELTGVDFAAFASHQGANAFSEGYFAFKEKGANGAFVHSSLAKVISTKPSESLQLLTSRGALSLTITDIVDSSVGAPLIVTDISVLWSHLGEEGTFDTLVLFPRSSGQKKSISPEFVSQSTSGLLSLISNDDKRRQGDNLLAAFRTNILVMVIITILVGAFAVANGMMIGVSSLIHDLAILRSYGVSARSVKLIILIEGAILGLTGSLVGISIGLPLVQLISDLLLTTVSQVYLQQSSFTSELVNSNRIVLSLIAIILGTLCALFGALYPAWQSSRFPLIQVVRSGFRRGKEIHVKQRIRSAFFLFIVTVGCFFISVQYSSLSFCYVGIFLLLFTVIEIAPLVVGLIVTLLGRYQDSSNGLKKLLVVRTISGYLAVGQIGESVRASARGIAIAAVGVALMVGVEGMVTSFRLSLLDWMERTFAADIYISSTTQSTMNAVNTLPKIVEQRLKEFPYVKSLQPSITYTVPLGELLISVTGILFEAKEMQKAYQLKSGRYPNSKNYVFELVASTSALRRLKKRIGDKIHVFGKDWLIVGSINDFTRDRGTLFINYDVLTSITSAESPETIGVFLNTVSEVLEVKENLKQIFKDFNLRFTDSFELKRSVEKLFNDTFRITDILQVIIGALGGIGFFTNVFQHLLERRHRYSLLRTMGVRVRELMIALIIEVVLVLVPALGAGAFVGVVLSSILVLIVNPLAFGWDLNLIISSSQILVPVIVMGCSALASTLAALLWCFPPPSACRDMH